jgi:hypothetical protein
MRIKARTFVPALLALALATGACTGGSATPTTPPPTSAPRLASTATLTIMSPTDGEVVHGSTVDLKIDLKGGTIVPLTSTDLTPNEGHIHVSLDGQLVSMTTGTNLQIPNVAPGHHLIQAEFVATDHGPFNPRIIAVVSFQVKA